MTDREHKDIELSVEIKVYDNQTGNYEKFFIGLWELKHHLNKNPKDLIDVLDTMADKVPVNRPSPSNRKSGPSDDWLLTFAACT